MNTLGHSVIIVLLVIGVGAACLWLFFELRARRLYRHIGSFRCWSRPDRHSGWTTGIAQYHVDSLKVYRLVSFSYRPIFSVARQNLDVSAPVKRSSDGSIVEIRLSSGDQRYELSISSSTYNGLVSWIESGPPRSR